MNTVDMLRIAREVRGDCAMRVSSEFRDLVLGTQIDLSCKLKDAAGRAISPWRMIQLSVPVFTHPGNAARAEEELDDTVRHEIAHILTPGDGHESMWWWVYRALGGCHDTRFHYLATPRPPGTIWCTGCGSRVASCGKSSANWVADMVVSGCCGVRCCSRRPGPTQDILPFKDEPTDSGGKGDTAGRFESHNAGNGASSDGAPSVRGEQPS